MPEVAAFPDFESLKEVWAVVETTEVRAIGVDPVADVATVSV